MAKPEYLYAMFRSIILLPGHEPILMRMLLAAVSKLHAERVHVQSDMYMIISTALVSMCVDEVESLASDHTTALILLRPHFVAKLDSSKEYTSKNLLEFSIEFGLGGFLVTPSVQALLESIWLIAFDFILSLVLSWNFCCCDSFNS